MFKIHSSRYDGEVEACFVCDICDERFLTNLELTGHAEKHHRDTGSIQCKFFDECLQCKTELMRHNKEEYSNSGIILLELVCLGIRPVGSDILSQ